MSSQILLEQQPLFSMQSEWFEGAFHGFPETHSFDQATESPRSWQYEAAEGRYNPAYYLNQTQPVPSPQARTHPHRRALSNSTLASYTSSNSPYIQSQNLPQSAGPAPTFDDPFYYESSYGYSSNPTFPKNLPTPSRTPTNDGPGIERSLQPPSSDPGSAQHGSGMMNQHSWNGMGYSGQNQNAYHHQNLPNTPRTTNGDERDEQQGGAYAGDIPGWEQDQSLFPAPIQTSQMHGDMYASVPTVQGHRHSGNQHMMMYHQQSLINQRLQDARSSASPGSIDRQASPFRHGSPYAAPGQSYSQIQTPISATRRQVKAEPDMAFDQHRQQDEAQPKTISPKDAVLEYHPDMQEDSAPPSLFPETSNTSERSFDGQQSYVQMPNERRTNRPGYQVPSSNFDFVPPSMPASGSRASYQSQADFKFSHPGALGSNASNDEPPDYPAHLVHMETSKSEPELISSQQSHDDAEMEKPSGATADGGTYTCTYHGCTQRFRSPADLQRHKREGHRSGAQGHGNSSASRSDSPSLASAYKNSQAGPHRCDRINPSTGKPCSTIFSRPYDLTRHEDTIHNAQKKKVRCQLCTEEKTFSRSDALTRHMRVVHPEVDFPGKHRRRNGGVM